MNDPVEDLLVRVLVAEVFPTGVGNCRACSEPVVLGIEALLSHYSAEHRDIVVGALAMAVLGFGVTVFAVRSARS